MEEKKVTLKDFATIFIKLFKVQGSVYLMVIFTLLFVFSLISFIYFRKVNYLKKELAKKEQIIRTTKDSLTKLNDETIKLINDLKNTEYEYSNAVIELQNCQKIIDKYKKQAKEQSKKIQLINKILNDK